MLSVLWFLLLFVCFLYLWGEIARVKGRFEGHMRGEEMSGSVVHDVNLTKNQEF